jgi:hypothetical protein
MFRVRFGLNRSGESLDCPEGKEWGVMEPPNDSTPLVQPIGATSIAEIEKLIGELQETRNFLESEGERIQRETARYIDLTQRALASVRIIFDTPSGWQQAGHPMRKFVTTRSPAEDNT